MQVDGTTWTHTHGERERERESERERGGETERESERGESEHHLPGFPVEKKLPQDATSLRPCTETLRGDARG